MTAKGGGAADEDRWRAFGVSEMRGAYSEKAAAIRRTPKKAGRLGAEG